CRHRECRANALATGSGHYPGAVETGQAKPSGADVQPDLSYRPLIQPGGEVPDAPAPAPEIRDHTRVRGDARRVIRQLRMVERIPRRLVLHESHAQPRWDALIARDAAQVECYPVRPPAPLEAARREPRAEIAGSSGVQRPAPHAARGHLAGMGENLLELLRTMRAREARKQDRALATAALRAPDPCRSSQSV